MSLFENVYITNVTHVLENKYEEKMGSDMQDRENYGICFVKKGSVIYQHREGRYVCHEGQAILLPKGATYTWQCSDGCCVFIINFATTEDFQANTFVQIMLKDICVYQNDLSVLKKAYFSKNGIGSPKDLSVLYGILERLNREMDAGQYSPMRHIIDFIHENSHNEGLDNAVLAEQAHLSISHFRSLFKKVYQISPMKYVQTVRIEKAKQFLLYADFSVTEIAEKCGFSNVYCFSRAFKERVGVSPNQFAKRNKVNVI